MEWDDKTRIYKLRSGRTIPQQNGLTDLDGPIGPTFDIGWMRNWTEFSQDERNEIADFMASEWREWAADN